MSPFQSAKMCSLADRLRPSRISRLALPILPPMSPPPGVTVFPDEVETQPEAGPSYLPIAKPPSRPPSPPVRSSPRYRPPSRSGASGSPPPQHVRRTPSKADPRLFAEFQRPLKGPIPEWIPHDNCRPATIPTASPPSVVLPLETEYASNISWLPSVPISKRHRRGSKTETRKADLDRLRHEYALNPVAKGLAKSLKCVLTGDWRVAQSETRHVRAMQKVEAKMTEGRWSLRQPKKLRSPSISKSHWDYLLDEVVSSLVLMIFGSWATGMDADRFCGGTAMEGSASAGIRLSDC